MLALLILTPPFMFPDEVEHFKRAYSLSSGQVWLETREGRTGMQAPASINAQITWYFEPRASNALPLAATWAQLRRPLEPERTDFLNQKAAAVYAPPAYAPQALAIAAGRAVELGPLWLLYLARLANLAAAAALVAYALKVMPLGREAGLLVALLPMSQALMASASPDALTIGGAFVFTALLTRSFHDGVWSLGRVLPMAVCGALMCCTKAVYVPMMACGAAVLVSAVAGPRRARIAAGQVAIALAVALAAAWWLVSTDAVGADQRPGTNRAHQLAVVLADPAGFGLIVVNSILQNASFLFKSTLGVLGWTNLFLPNWTYLMLAAGLPLSLAASRDRPSPLPLAAFAWFALLMLAVVALVELGLFVIWTPVTGSLIEGVQGRYFLPLLPLAGYMLASLWAPLRRFADPDACYAALLVVIGVASVTTLIATARFFGLFAA